MSVLKKVQPGQPMVISAGAYNAFVDAANDLKNRQMQGGAGVARLGQSTGIVSVKNTTSEILSRFDVIGLAGPLWLPSVNEEEFKNKIVMAGVEPTTSLVGKIAVLQETLAPEAIGRGLVSGVTNMRLGGIAPELVGSVLWKGDEWAIVSVGGGGMSYSTLLGVGMVGASPWVSGHLIWNKTNDVLPVSLNYYDCTGAVFSYVVSGGLAAHIPWSFVLDDIINLFTGDDALTPGQGCLEVVVTDVAHVGFLSQTSNGTIAVFSPLLQGGWV